MGSGSYRAATMQEVPDSPAATSIKNTRTTQKNTLTVPLSAGGGYLGMFTKE